MGAVRFQSYTEARGRFKDLLDAAQRGRVATVRRDSVTAAVVDGERLRSLLASSCRFRATVLAEDEGWSAYISGLPIAADGATLDEAIDDLIDALRDYADDWQERLVDAPNHRDNWGLVQLICLSTDEQLRQWLVGER